MLKRIAALLGFVLLLAACGSDDGAAEAKPTPVPDASFPVTIPAADGKVTLEEAPDRIVSLSPTSTEMLFAIGAGDQVAAVDDQSNFPPEAPMTDLSGLEPNVEAVAGYEPDLVIAANDLGDLVGSLDKLDVPVLLHPAATSFEDVYLQLEQLGLATGNTDEAAAVIEDMQTEIDAIVEDVPDFDKAPTYYHELDPTFFSVTSETFIGQVYGELGLENIADEAKGAGSGYPQLSAEYIIDVDPDLIFLADTKCCNITADKVASRPGWNQIDAVQSDHVINLDDDIASRWGPRIVDLLRTVADAVKELEGVGSM
jgi:iron complex transport system substrate-binding protein